MAKPANLIGQTFGRLSVIAVAGRNARGKTLVRCVCACGKETSVLPDRLKSGHTKSCGCARRRGSANPAWRGDEVGYGSAHARLGPIAGRPCVDCGEPGKDWSLRADTPQERLRADSNGKNRGRKFSTVPADYEIRCARCHARYDGLVGEGNASAKLTAMQVLEARALYRPGICGHRISDLAARFGAAYTSMRAVLTRRTWAHVAAPAARDHEAAAG